MQQHQGRPAIRERKVQGPSTSAAFNQRQEEQPRERRVVGEPAKFNTRSEQRRICWENDLYERQSI